MADCGAERLGARAPVGVQVDERDVGYEFRVHAYLGDVRPDWVEVQVFAESFEGGAPTVVTLPHEGPLVGSVNGHVYRGIAPPDRPAEQYRPRIIATHPHASVPLEAAAMQWWTP